MNLQDLMFILLGFDLPLVLFISVPHSSPHNRNARKLGMFCIIEGNTIYFYFYRSLNLRTALVIKKILEFVKNGGTSETL